jgi:small subunit ribosomal protein S2
MQVEKREQSETKARVSKGKEVSDNKTKKKENTFELERPLKLTKTLLLESGAHFGHKIKDWHPKAFPYLYGIQNSGSKNKTHIIDLKQTVKIWPEIKKLIQETIYSGKSVLFVGTKRQASNIIREEATNCNQPFVDYKWKGGTLTNFKTIKTRVKRLENLEKVLNDPVKSASYVKKELLLLDKEREKLDKTLGGIRDMKTLPGLVFVIDINREKIAVSEARNLGIPVLGLLDSNCNPDNLDYFIPMNDDAYKSIKVITAAVSDSILEAKEVIQTNKSLENDGADSPEEETQEPIQSEEVKSEQIVTSGSTSS